MVEEPCDIDVVTWSKTMSVEICTRVVCQFRDNLITVFDKSTVYTIDFLWSLKIRIR